MWLLNRFLLLLCVLLSVSVFAKQKNGEMLVEMAGVVNKMSEQCLPLKAGDSIRYQFNSPSPLNFNIHYHTEKTTGFQVKLTEVSRHQGEFSTAVDQEYCFMWTNKIVSQQQWMFYLHYTISHSE